MAANRIGKTEGVGLYEVVLHATGVYPDWWEGRVFQDGLNIWVAGDTSKTVREILQRKLLGRVGQFGTGLLPRNSIKRIAYGRGVSNMVDYIEVRHASGSTSQITLKSYEQGRKSFQGSEVDIILLDEEPAEGILSECLIRTMTTKGMVLMTFTPLLGLSAVVMRFLNSQREAGLEPDARPLALLINVTWDEVPHLDEETKAELLEQIPPNQRNARSKGVPQIGSGQIYPVNEDLVVVPPTRLARHWPRVYAMDVGWNVTAVLWGAINFETDTLYIYDEYYGSRDVPVVHADAIKKKGGGLLGVIDPSSLQSSQQDGRALIDLYRQQGLDLVPAKNTVEEGLFEVWTRFEQGRLLIMSHCTKTLHELRLYRRNEVGKVVKSDDHLMDCLRYLVSTGLGRCIPAQALKQPVPRSHLGWMGS
ncbi:MAG: terminase family protein [Candidatus Thiodiazotropha taylori]|nr:terminase family protein [Candidatus Thiodiazotropha taylori]